ncbi:MAG: class I SAM-dependent methyltransferase [Candidatus Methylomirabilales bacterium]
MIEPRAAEAGLCPVCGGGSWRTIRSADAFAVARCRTCGLARTEPAPAESDGREHFAEDYAHYKRFYDEQRELRYSFVAPPLRLLEEFVGRGRILDVGCGLGFFLDSARQHGYECVGIDTSVGATRFAREDLHLDVVTGDFLAANFEPANPFDAITMNHVLEHISSPIRFLGKVRRLLRPGGVAISASPNYGGLVPRLLGHRWYGLQPSQHVWQFTPGSYAALFRTAGFTVERTEVTSMHYAFGSGWKGDVCCCLARLATVLGQGDNMILVARALEGEPPDG